MAGIHYRSEDVSGRSPVVYDDPRALPYHREYVGKSVPVLLRVRSVASVRPHEERYPRSLELCRQELHLLPALVPEIPRVAHGPELCFGAVDHHCRTVNVHIGVLEAVPPVEALPKARDDLVAVIPDQRHRAVDRPLGQPGIQAQLPPDLAVPQPVGASAHGITAHQDVRAHRHKDPAHRDAAFLQGVRIVEDADRTEIVFDRLDEPVGN